MAEMSITHLKITSEDGWLDQYIRAFGDGVAWSPQHRALMGDTQPLREWMSYRGLDWHDAMRDILSVYVSVRDEGQKEPILIYEDYSINTGHKRAASLLALGQGAINFEFVKNEKGL